ncbi:MAG: hypothetical protein ACM37U_12510 [Gemmatimonas sp.]
MALEFSPRSFVAVAGLFVSAHSLVFAQGAPRGRLAGIAYTIHVTSTPHGGSGGAGAMAGAAQNYVGHAVFAANRGRMDIVEGGVEALFSKGDYILFDSTDLVIVHPASKVFVQLPHDLASQTMERLESIGVKMTIADEKVALDSLGFGDTVAGVPTSHYRMTTAFTMSIDASIAQQRLATESTTEYWVASVPGLPQNPLLRANGLSGPSAMAGMFKSISLKVDSAAKRMGSAVALKTSTVSRLIDGRGTNTMMEQTSDVSGIERRDVDDTAFVLPPDYKPSAVAGVEETISDDVGAKWRLPPRPRPTKTERPMSRPSSMVRRSRP